MTHLGTVQSPVLTSSGLLGKFLRQLKETFYSIIVLHCIIKTSVFTIFYFAKHYIFKDVYPLQFSYTCWHRCAYCFIQHLCHFPVNIKICKLESTNECQRFTIKLFNSDLYSFRQGKKRAKKKKPLVFQHFISANAKIESMQYCSPS